jgi:hypothetical protein
VRVATTRAATTRRVVANLCFTRFSLSAARRTLDRHEPNLARARGSVLDLYAWGSA